MCLLETIHAHPMPMAVHLGIEFLEAERDQVTGWMQTGPEHCTLGHAVHGGVIMAFADSLGGATAFINLPGDAKGTTTLESKTNFIAAAPAGASLVGVASLLHRGRRTQVVQTRVETGQGHIVALVTQTQMILFAEDGARCDADYLARARREDADA
ncbi:MAG: PaaI family thioesterase [Caulobacteraceae bacterium]